MSNPSTGSKWTFRARPSNSKFSSGNAWILLNLASLGSLQFTNLRAFSAKLQGLKITNGTHSSCSCAFCSVALCKGLLQIDIFLIEVPLNNLTPCQRKIAEHLQEWRSRSDLQMAKYLTSQIQQDQQLAMLLFVVQDIGTTLPFQLFNLFKKKTQDWINSIF